VDGREKRRRIPPLVSSADVEAPRVEQAVAPEWRCVCGSTGKRMKGKELVCFSCGRPA
jgi:hypothetical protein